MALSPMESTPRSSRRRCTRRSSREDVVIGSPYLTSRSLGDEVSGTGSPTTPIREDVDLAEVNQPVVAQSNANETDFGIEGYVDYRMERRHVADEDSWALSLLGQWLRYKELELEDDLEFKS